MNRQQVSLPSYRHIAGAVQIPLVMLVWGALVLFFGHQYQANALLPSHNRLAEGVSLDANELLQAQQRNDRLLAQLAAQAPVAIPSLLDREAFALDLAAELAKGGLAQDELITQQDTQQDNEQDNEQDSAVSKAALQPAPSAPKTRDSVVLVKPTIEPQPSRTAATKFQETKAQAIKVQTIKVHATKVQPKSKAAKFVRLPAVVQSKAAMRVDPLRASKDRARVELLAGRTGAAYQRLRGQISKGRTDIEYLGLLALASLPQQPAEAEVIYQHLTQLQPEAHRWQQGLEQSQRLLAARAILTSEPMSHDPVVQG